VDVSFTDAPRQRNSREENQQIKDGKRPEGFETSSSKGSKKTVMHVRRRKTK
jgi:transposase, IS5 family